METLEAFYKVHYNFAAISVIIFMWAIFLIIRGNVKWFLIVMATLIVYNLAMKRAIEKDPKWFDETMAKVQAFDFVDILWGGSAVTKQNATSEKRLNQ